MKIKRWKWLLFGTVLLMITGIALCILSQRNIQKYEPSEEVFGNPLMGYAPCAWNAEVREDVSLLYGCYLGRTGAGRGKVQLGRN